MTKDEGRKTEAVRKLLLDFDHRFSTRMRVAERPGFLRSLAAVLAHSGDSWFWLAGLGLVWLVGAEFWRERAAILIASILITAVLVLGVKFTIRRQRPQGEWGEVYRKTDPHSFPSGHAARATLLAVTAAGLGPAWFAAALLAWAPLVGLARIAMGVHYISDVVAGMLLGALLALVVIRLVG